MAAHEEKTSELADNFKVLDLPTDVSYDDLRKAYIRLAKLYHPDKNGDVERFKKVNAAYVAISETMAAGTEGRATPLDDKLLGYFLGSTENSKSVTIKVPTDAINKWHTVLTGLYGSPKSQLGGKGDKYIAEKCVKDEDGQFWGSVHITVYHTGKILVQGSSYLLWHATCLTHILHAVCEDPNPPITATEPVVIAADPAASDESTSPVPTDTSSSDTTAQPDKKDPHCCQHKQCNKLIHDRLDSLEINLVQTLEVMHRENQALQLDAKDRQICSLTTELNSLKKELQNVKQSKLGADQEREELKRSRDNMKQALENATADKVVKKLQADIQALQSITSDMEKSVGTYKSKIQLLEKESADLRKSKQATNEENCSLHERLAKKEADILSAETALQIMRTELHSAQDEVKSQNVQLRTVLEEGTSDFQMVTKSRIRKANTSQDTPTKRADDAVNTVAAVADDPNTTNGEGIESSKVTLQTSRDEGSPPTGLSSRASKLTQQPQAPTNKHDQGAVNRLKPDPERHLIITSSLGRNLDHRRLLPGSNGQAYVESIPGGGVEDVESAITRARGAYQTITVLAGGNNISRRDSVDSCVGKFESLIQTCKRHHASARINVCEIPPRPAQDIRHQLVSLNERLRSLCAKHESVHWTPVQIDASDKFFVSDRIHLSRLGTSQLALDIRHAIDPSQPTRALWVSPTPPSSNDWTRTRGTGHRSTDSRLPPPRREQRGAENNTHNGTAFLVNLLRDVLSQTTDRIPDTRPDHYHRRAPARDRERRGGY